jgi:RNA polymerase sigma factor (sigma-70 family)
MTGLDTNFIEKLKGRDRDSFGQLYDSYSPALYGIVLRMVNSSEVAEDILQDAFVKIWKNLPNYDQAKGSIFTWMLNITRNTAIDAMRSKKIRPTTSFSDEVNAQFDQDNSLTINTSTIGVKDLVDNMKPEFREAINAVYFSGLTHEEAAENLNLPLGTLKTRVRAGLTELKRIFALLLWLLLTT